MAVNHAAGLITRDLHPASPPSRPNCWPRLPCLPPLPQGRHSESSPKHLERHTRQLSVLNGHLVQIFRANHYDAPAMLIELSCDVPIKRFKGTGMAQCRSNKQTGGIGFRFRMLGTAQPNRKFPSLYSSLPKKPKTFRCGNGMFNKSLAGSKDLEPPASDYGRFSIPGLPIRHGL